MCEIMFENFNTPGFYISNHPSLTLISQGGTCGVVVDSGENTTRITPIFESFCLKHNLMEMEIGGKDVTDYMCKLLLESGLDYNNIIDIEVVKDIKEKMGYVSLDYDNELKNMTDNLMMSHVKYKLPDGKYLPMSSDRIKCAEVIFKPKMINKDFDGVHMNCQNAIAKVDIDLRKELYGNIILCGGNSMFSGIQDRMLKEIQKLAPSTISSKIKVVTPVERKYSTWIGGSILSHLTSFQCMWITKSEFDEVGKSIVRKKCF